MLFAEMAIARELSLRPASKPRQLQEGLEAAITLEQQVTMLARFIGCNIRKPCSFPARQAFTSRVLQAEPAGSPRRRAPSEPPVDAEECEGKREWWGELPQCDCL